MGSVDGSDGQATEHRSPQTRQVQAEREEVLDLLRALAAEAELHARIMREHVEEAERHVRRLARDTMFGPPSAPS